MLDGLFKKSGLGYVIGTKKDGRYEGWLIIKKGNFRGTEGQAAARPAEKAKPAPKAVVEPAPVAPEDKEHEAARKLKLAKRLESDGVKDKAKERYQEIVRKFAGTKAAKEAAERLEKLDQ